MMRYCFLLLTAALLAGCAGSASVPPAPGIPAAPAPDDGPVLIKPLPY